MRTDKSILIEQLEWALVKVKYSPKAKFDEVAEHLDCAQSLVKKLAIPVVIGRFCTGQQVEWGELKYWVVEDNGEDKVLVANSKTKHHHEYNDWWVNRDELNAL